MYAYVLHAAELLEPSFMPLDVCLGNTRVYALHSLCSKMVTTGHVMALCNL